MQWLRAHVPGQGHSSPDHAPAQARKQGTKDSTTDSPEPTSQGEVDRRKKKLYAQAGWLGSLNPQPLRHMRAAAAWLPATA